MAWATARTVGGPGAGLGTRLRYLAAFARTPDASREIYTLRCDRGAAIVRQMGFPEATAEAFAGGWFHTGDLAVMHPDGYVEIKDRAKDIIISGGENISSLEVEEVLYKHPSVMEAADDDSDNPLAIGRNRR